MSQCGRSWVAARFWLRRCDRVGARAQVWGRPYVENLGRIEIGDAFWLASRPIQSHLVTGVGGLIRIGNRVTLGHGVAIAAHAEVTLGDEVQAAPLLVVMDTDFHTPGLREGSARPKPIHIGAHVQCGSCVTVLPGTRIGDGAKIAPGSVVSGVIPPRAFVRGVPARVVEPGDGESLGDLPDRIARLVQTVFGLSSPPGASEGPEQIPGWDSLGGLRLILALEEAFGISLNEDAWARVGSVEDIVRLIVRLTATVDHGNDGVIGNVAALFSRAPLQGRAGAAETSAVDFSGGPANG